MYAIVETLDHLLHVRAIGIKRCNHGEGLGSERSALWNRVVRTLDYIFALIHEMRAK